MKVANKVEAQKDYETGFWIACEKTPAGNVVHACSRKTKAAAMAAVVKREPANID